VVFPRPGGPEVIEVRQVEDPAPARGELLVRVRAAGVNRGDLLQRLGLYPPPPGVRADVPGLELSGEVAALGEGVSTWRMGDRVMAIAAGAAQCELAVVHERMAVRVPEALSFEEAGGVPESFITAHDALFTRGGLRPGWPVLIHAVGSGVATAAAQLASAAGATVIGTSRSPEKLERAKALGAHHGLLVDRAQPRFADEVKRLTGGEGVPLILDFVGASYAAENLAALAPLGRLVVIGVMGGPSAAIDLGTLLRRRLSVIGTVLRARPLEQKIDATRRFAREVVPLLAARRVRAVIDGALPLEQVAEAHRRMEANDSFGRLVLVP
jgi:putative PIG3 family NAD(P)H quinone oxidoreductase